MIQPQNYFNMKLQDFLRLRPIVKFFQWIYPNESTCFHCHSPWSKAKPHFVNYNENSSFFAVCEYCHQTMTDAELEAAYQNLWHKVWKDCKKPMSYIFFRNAYIKDIKARHK